MRYANALRDAGLYRGPNGEFEKEFDIVLSTSESIVDFFSLAVVLVGEEEDEGGEESTGKLAVEEGVTSVAVAEVVTVGTGCFKLLESTGGSKLLDSGGSVDLVVGESDLDKRSGLLLVELI